MILHARLLELMGLIETSVALPGPFQREVKSQDLVKNRTTKVSI
jgi:hypothetical protein